MASALTGISHVHRLRETALCFKECLRIADVTSVPALSNLCGDLERIESAIREDSVFEDKSRYPGSRPRSDNNKILPRG